MKKTKEYIGIYGTTALKMKKSVAAPNSLEGGQDAEAAKVRYFLHALNQMSLALQALGYTTEGAALGRVKSDLTNRLFSPSGKVAEVAQLLN